VSQIISVDVESGDRKQHTWTWHEGVTKWLNADRVAYVKKQGSDPGLEFTSGEKGAGVNFAIPPGPRMEHASCITGNCRLSVHWMTPTFSRDAEFDLMLTEPFPAYSPTGDQLIVSARPLAVASLCFRGEQSGADERGRTRSKDIFYDAARTRSPRSGRRVRI